MISNKIGLTAPQHEKVEQFLDLFADVEKALKSRLRLGVNNPTGVGVLINDYVKKNPYWADSANRLRNLTDIRNILIHQRGTDLGYPVAVTSYSVEALRAIKEHLVRPEAVSNRHRKTVQSVCAEASLATVLARAFDNGFSQFPVITGQGFGGLITENEITRWLGRRVKANSPEVNLATVTVKTVLREKDPFLKGISIFHFEKLDASVEEVMGLFSVEPALEVILLTQSGSKQTPIEGIITQWDAARYPTQVAR